ncbi:hypothetical protein SSS_05671 [Sarcoptes scabiei]|uniref:Uncharacterized protein n=1 Tax=Sarcoptes scabiei TaxID=52283 RepID=A0A834V999_SARSC|nr:hypothetical protein SSS_05671 [Sarcoptes scabiei]
MVECFEYSIDKNLVYITVLFCLFSSLIQSASILHHFAFWLEILFHKFSNQFGNYPCHHQQQCSFIEENIAIICQTKNNNNRNYDYDVYGPYLIRENLTFSKFIIDSIVQIAKLGFLFVAIKCITLQWKMLNCLIYFIGFGFNLISSFTNQDLIHRFNQRCLQRMRRNNYSIADRFNRRYFWMRFLINLINYGLVFGCCISYLINNRRILFDEGYD